MAANITLPCYCSYREREIIMHSNSYLKRTDGKIFRVQFLSHWSEIVEIEPKENVAPETDLVKWCWVDKDGQGEYISNQKGFKYTEINLKRLAQEYIKEFVKNYLSTEEKDKYDLEDLQNKYSNHKRFAVLVLDGEMHCLTNLIFYNSFDEIPDEGIISAYDLITKKKYMTKLILVEEK